MRTSSDVGVVAVLGIAVWVARSLAKRREAAKPPPPPEPDRGKRQREVAAPHGVGPEQVERDRLVVRLVTPTRSMR